MWVGCLSLFIFCVDVSDLSRCSDRRSDTGNIIIIIIIIIIIMNIPLEFFTSVLADGFSLEFEWQQVSSSLQD